MGKIGEWVNEKKLTVQAPKSGRQPICRKKARGAIIGSTCRKEEEMRRMVSVLTAMAVLLVFAGIGQAQDRKGETPLTIPGVKELKAEDLKKMIDKKEKIVVVDSRIASEYKEAHIPGAINIVEKDMEKDKDKLPKDKSAAVAFYCNGGQVLEEPRRRGQGCGHGVQERLPAPPRNPGVEGQGIPDGVTAGFQRSAFSGQPLPLIADC